MRKRRSPRTGPGQQRRGNPQRATRPVPPATTGVSDGGSHSGAPFRAHFMLLVQSVVRGSCSESRARLGVERIATPRVHGGAFQTLAVGTAKVKTPKSKREVH